MMDDRILFIGFILMKSGAYSSSSPRKKHEYDINTCAKQMMAISLVELEGSSDSGKRRNI
jgi:hypothetical protein